MTDLASRIADGRKKAEEAKPGIFWAYRMEYIDVDRIGKPAHEYITTASPSLFIEMADKIDRLTAELEKARQALEPFAKAADSYNQNKHHDDYFIDYEAGVIRAHHLRTAARVHADLTGEKEKE